MNVIKTNKDTETIPVKISPVHLLLDLKSFHLIQLLYFFSKIPKKIQKNNFMQLFSADTTIFFFAPQNKKMPSKIAHNPTRVIIPASFCFVELRQLFSLTFSHFSSCQTFQDEFRVSR